MKIIDEKAMENCINRKYPSLHMSKSTMEIPASDFVRISSYLSSNKVSLETSLRNAVRNLASYLHERGIIAKPMIMTENNRTGNPVDMIYRDKTGSKVAVAMMIEAGENDATINVRDMNDKLGSINYADKITIITNTGLRLAEPISKAVQIVNLDSYMIADLIYFNDKYNRLGDSEEYSKRTILLAKSIFQC